MLNLIAPTVPKAGLVQGILLEEIPFAIWNRV